jgi:hypothetical protein
MDQPLLGRRVAVLMGGVSAEREVTPAPTLWSVSAQR